MECEDCAHHRGTDAAVELLFANTGNPFDGAAIQIRLVDREGEEHRFARSSSSPVEAPGAVRHHMRAHGIAMRRGGELPRPRVAFDSRGSGSGVG